MAKNKVLIVLPSNKLGGAEHVLFMIAERLIKRGYNLEIYCLSRVVENDVWRNLPCFVKTYNVKRPFMGMLFFLMNILGSCFEVTLSSQVYLNSFLAIASRFNLIKVDKIVCRESTSVFVRFSGFKKQLYKLYYTFGYFNIDVLVCQSELMKNQFLDNVRFDEKKIKVLTNPVETYKLKELSNATELLKDFPFDYIVTVGRLIPEKGIDNLLRAFEKCLDFNEELHLLILGDGPEMQNLKCLAATLGLTGRVCFLGYVENPFPFMRFAKLCVVSSYVEGFPNTLLQMIALNNAVVSTLCAGGIEKIDGIFIASEFSVESLYKAMNVGLNSKNISNNRFIFDGYLANLGVDNYVDNLLGN